MYSVCSPKFRRWLPQKSVILLAHVSPSADSVILVGDFNLPDVCWWSSLIGQSPFSNSFCDFEHSFSQLVDCPTHVKGNILDLVYTTSESIISDFLVTRPHALISTDHHTVSFKVYPYLLQQFATSQYPSLMFMMHWLHWIQLRQWELMDLYQPIHYLFVLCLTQHYLPKEWSKSDYTYLQVRK